VSERALDKLDPVLVHHIVNTLGWQELRPLQRAAIEPLTAGSDALLLAPTAGGKTEAAMFPLLSRMTSDSWQGVSVLYLCPLKALLNNLAPRLDRYAGWVGRRAAVWHGDIGQSGRRAVLGERPDILLTTPESLEAMLVSAKVDHRDLFSGLRAVVIDEVHAFAGDDRGWHLLAVLERLTHLVGRPIQRVGLSATVGNPDQLLTWLQGAGVGTRPGIVVAPESGRSGAVSGPPQGEVELDYVGTLANAATVIASLHGDQKRLVFCESRQTVEQLGHLLREKGITTFLSHASLSADERRRSEEAFADARDCVIVSTSTLELGIDVGDLDRVIQINAPSTVASFLQRIGRTGRRTGSTRNCLFLATEPDGLLKAAGLLLLWGRGWVEPVVAPPQPLHIVAQQILALCLQQNRIGDRQWVREWNGLAPFDSTAEPILRHLIDRGFLDSDGGMLHIGPEAERKFGRRHFMDMTAVFTGPPEFTVLTGRVELGRIGPSVLTEEVRGDRRLLLGGRSWRVTHIDWQRRRCFVEPADGGGKARWTSLGTQGLGFELARSMRDVLLGEDPPVRLTHRAVSQLAVLRQEHAGRVHSDATLIVRGDDGDDVRWWTWAGFRANATLVANMGGLVDPFQRFDDRFIRLRDGVDPAIWKAAVPDRDQQLRMPEVSEKALTGLKFSAALPTELAMATLGARVADIRSAEEVLADRVRFA
jgi:ATP-dependent Lhr-like helicase